MTLATMIAPAVVHVARKSLGAIGVIDRHTGGRLARWRAAHKQEVVELCDKLEYMSDEPMQHQPAVSRALERSIMTYQRSYSDGRNVCSRGPGRNCSHLGVKAVRNFGPLQAIMSVFVILFVSPHLNDSGGLDLDDCCGR